MFCSARLNMKKMVELKVEDMTYVSRGIFTVTSFFKNDIIDTSSFPQIMGY